MQRSYSAQAVVSIASVLRATMGVAGMAGLPMALVPLMAVPQLALAQNKIKDAAPFHAVVTAELANVHAGNYDSYYTVVSATKGAVLVVDGEDARWSRVAYAGDWPAFVKPGDGMYDAASSTFTLSKASTLLAYSTDNPQHCWQSLLPDSKPAASGTKLKVLGTIKNTGGELVGYKVVAPEGARGYVESRILRRATKEEIEAQKARGLLPVLPATSPTAPPATTPGVKPTTSTPPAAAPAGTKPATPDRSLLEPIKPATDGSKPTTPTTTPPTATPPASSPTSTPSATPTTPAVTDHGLGNPANPPTATPGTPDPTTPTTPTTPPTPTKQQRHAASLEQIEAAYKLLGTRKADDFGAEYDQLLAEINKTIGELGDTPVDSQRKKQLQLRADVLKLRIDIRDSLKSVEASKRGLNSDIQKAQQVVDAADKSRVYTLVGTLASSTVYDGKAMPLMYRIVSAGTGAPTTLGYLKPEAAFKLESKVGQIIGVVGEAAYDETLKLNIVQPARVDLLDSPTGTTLPTLQPTTLPTPILSDPAKTSRPAGGPTAPKPVDVVK